MVVDIAESVCVTCLRRAEPLHRTPTVQFYIRLLLDNQDVAGGVCSACERTVQDIAAFREQARTSHAKYQALLDQCESDAAECLVLQSCPPRVTGVSNTNHLTQHSDRPQKEPDQSDDTDHRERCDTASHESDDEILSRVKMKLGKCGAGGAEAAGTAQRAVGRDGMKKRHACSSCDKSFVTAPVLRRHVESVHLGLRRHACPLCDKRYATPSALWTHKRLRHERRPLVKDKVCHVCGQLFATNTSLADHLRCHTGERPFRCGECRATFRHNSGLYMHRRRLHTPRAV